MDTHTPGTPGRQWEPSTVNRRRTQKMLEKFGRKPFGGDTAAKGQASTAPWPSDQHEAERHEEFNLFYHGPQTTRGAGNNPGLGSAHRGFSLAQNDTPNTPFSMRGHDMTPITPLYTTQRGPLTPSDRTGAPSPAPAVAPSPHDTMYLRPKVGSMGRCPYCSGGGQVDNGLWVTLFGFPQGYQDGMLKILRDRGEILEHSYSGTNHISVKFKTSEAVADAVGLNGSILPADGLPGENYMIGVKRGAALIERGDVAANLDEPTNRAQRNGAGARVPKDRENSNRSFIGRFWSELLDITDLSIRD